MGIFILVAMFSVFDVYTWYYFYSSPCASTYDIHTRSVVDTKQGVFPALHPRCDPTGPYGLRYSHSLPGGIPNPHRLLFGRFSDHMSRKQKSASEQPLAYRTENSRCCRDVPESAQVMARFVFLAVDHFNLTLHIPLRCRI